jgi:hypothetical protein
MSTCRTDIKMPLRHRWQTVIIHQTNFFGRVCLREYDEAKLANGIMNFKRYNPLLVLDAWELSDQARNGNARGKGREERRMR